MHSWARLCFSFGSHIVPCPDGHNTSYISMFWTTKPFMWLLIMQIALCGSGLRLCFSFGSHIVPVPVKWARTSQLREDEPVTMVIATRNFCPGHNTSYISTFLTTKPFMWLLSMQIALCGYRCVETFTTHLATPEVGWTSLIKKA